LKYTFPKTERLHSKKIIQELFEKGSSFYLYPFKIVYLSNPYDNDQSLPQFLVSVSKKKFKKAVDRNKIKRRIKEAYRLNKHSLEHEEATTKSLCLGLIYTGKEIHEYKLIESKVKKLIVKLVELNSEVSE
jgi:ribonuclease P protein component